MHERHIFLFFLSIFSPFSPPPSIPPKHTNKLRRQIEIFFFSNTIFFLFFEKQKKRMPPSKKKRDMIFFLNASNKTKHKKKQQWLKKKITEPKAPPFLVFTAIYLRLFFFHTFFLTRRGAFIWRLILQRVSSGGASISTIYSAELFPPFFFSTPFFFNSTRQTPSPHSPFPLFTQRRAQNTKKKSISFSSRLFSEIF